MKHHHWLCAALLTSSAMAGFSHVAHAQNASIPTMPEIAADELQMREIAVKNVPIRLMAWWIDSAHNDAPISVQQSLSNQRASGDTDAPQTPRIFDSLPAGVLSAIVASDARNSLLVVGTKSGIETVKAAMKKSDVPLQQIEVEALAIRLSATDAENLGLKFSILDGEINAGRTTPITLARTTDSKALQLKVRDLMFWDQTKIVRSPRVTAINGLTASLMNSETRPFVMGFDKDRDFPIPVLNKTDKKPAILYVSTAVGLTVTPTINPDHTVTLDLMPAKTLQTSLVASGSEPSPMSKGLNTQNSNVTTVVPLGILEGFRYNLTVANNETVAFGGLSTSLFQTTRETENAQTAPTTNLILLVTARILPRFDE